MRLNIGKLKKLENSRQLVFGFFISCKWNPVTMTDGIQSVVLFEYNL